MGAIRPYKVGKEANMPALVNKDYEDDGVYIWLCSECDFGVAMRGSGRHWKQCPQCGVTYTHNEEANTCEANDVRYERGQAQYRDTRTRPVVRYTIRTWMSNEGRRYEHDGFTNMLRKDLWDPEINVPEWLNWEDSPQAFKPLVLTNLTAREAREILQRLSVGGWPKWIERQ